MDSKSPLNRQQLIGLVKMGNLYSQRTPQNHGRMLKRIIDQIHWSIGQIDDLELLSAMWLTAMPKTPVRRVIGNRIVEVVVSSYPGFTGHH